VKHSIQVQTGVKFSSYQVKQSQGGIFTLLATFVRMYY
jgi:hypothetical protein